MQHNDIAIGIVANKLMETALKDSTPKRLAGTMYEAAEIIKQLKAERDQAAKQLEKHLSENTAPAPQWISVKDRLPEPFVSVLVCMPDEEPMPTVREGYLSECGFMVPALLQHIPVTHWAEMPDPPKEV